MQIVGEMWLMVKLTGSGVSVGLTAGLQFLPILLFGAWGGLLADRMPKRTLLTITQLSLMVPALTLFALSPTGVVAAVDGARRWCWCAARCWRWTTPRASRSWSRSSAPTACVNAVALNCVVVHCSRILGPAAAGTIIALVGIAPCFLVNAFSFLAMFIALRTMDAGAAADAQAGGARARRGAQRAAVRAAHARVADPAGDDGAGRDDLVQLPGAAAAAGRLHLARHRRDLRAADRGDGRRLGGRRAGRGRARARVRRGCSSSPRRCSASSLLLAAVGADAGAADRWRSCRWARRP